MVTTQENHLVGQVRQDLPYYWQQHQHQQPKKIQIETLYPRGDKPIKKETSGRFN